MARKPGESPKKMSTTPPKRKKVVEASTNVILASDLATPEDEVIGIRGMHGAKLMQKMMGLDSGPTYVVIAILQEDKIVVVRKIPDGFKVKFYPDAEAWGFTIDELAEMCKIHLNHRKHQYYDRIFFSEEGLNDLVFDLLQKAKGQPRTTKMKVLAFEQVLSLF